MALKAEVSVIIYKVSSRCGRLLVEEVSDELVKSISRAESSLFIFHYRPHGPLFFTLTGIQELPSPTEVADY